MPLDHYVSQVHLKQFYSPSLGGLMHATKKSDLKSFRCNAKSVCRIEAGSTNAYLTHDRAIEEFLQGVEPKYDSALAKVRVDEIDQESIAAISGFAAYVACCAPAAMRIHSKPLENSVITTAMILDRARLLPKAPAALGNKSMTELLADATLWVDVDQKFAQAIGISNVIGRVSIWGNSPWDLLFNDDPANPFFTSDFPVALEARENGIANWIVPLAPDLAVRIIPDVNLSGMAPDLTFRQFRCRRRKPARSEVLEVNRLIIRCAEDMVFYRDNLPWVHDFIAKNRHYRIETSSKRIPRGTGFLDISTQQVVSFRQPRAQ